MAEGNLFSGFSNSLSGLQPGSLTGFFNNNLLVILWFWIKVIIILGSVALAGVLFYKYYLSYKKKVTLWSSIGDMGSGGWELRYDVAKEVTDEQGKTKLQLFKFRKAKQPLTVPVPESKYKTKVGRFDHYNFLVDDNKELHPMLHPIIYGQVIVNPDTGEVEKNPDGSLAQRLETLTQIVPQDRSAWRLLDLKRVHKKFEKEDPLYKYAPYALTAVSIIFSFLIFWFAVKELGGNMSQMTTAFQQVAANCGIVR